MSAPAPYNRRLVIGLSVAQLISWGSIFYLFALLMAPVERDLGLSRAQSSVAFSLALLAEGLLAYPVGRLIDRGHERWLMAGGSLLLGACLLLLSTVTSLAGFYAVWLALGVGMSATLYTPVFSVVTRRFPGDFRRAIITLTFLGGLASTVFIPLIAWLISHLGWRHALWPLAALHFGACAPLHFFLLENPPRPAAIIANVGGFPARRGPLLGHLMSAPFWLLGTFVVLMMAVTAALPTHMVNLFRENGMTEAWAIAVPASIGVIQVLGRLLLFYFEHHVNVHTANRLIPVLVPLGLTALLLANSPGTGGSGLTLVFLGLFVLLWGMGNGMLTIVKGTAMAQYVSQDHVASLNGALGLPLALARATAPIGLGLLWSQQTGYTTGIWVLLLMSVAATLSLMLAQRIALSRNHRLEPAAGATDWGPAVAATPPRSRPGGPPDP
jgi:MFS family permease